MSFSLNKVQLIGNLTKDAETRFTVNNMAVTSFCIVTEHSYKGKDGNYVKKTTFHNCTSFNLSDYYKNALLKGKKFYVEGRLDKNEYTDKDGAKRQSVSVITENIIPLGSNSQSHEDHQEETRDSSGLAEPDIEKNDLSDLPF